MLIYRSTYWYLDQERKTIQFQIGNPYKVIIKHTDRLTGEQPSPGFLAPSSQDSIEVTKPFY
jgi:hypothetical protein